MELKGTTSSQHSSLHTHALNVLKFALQTAQQRTAENALTQFDTQENVFIVNTTPRSELWYSVCAVKDHGGESFCTEPVRHISTDSTIRYTNMVRVSEYTYDLDFLASHDTGDTLGEATIIGAATAHLVLRASLFPSPISGSGPASVFLLLCLSVSLPQLLSLSLPASASQTR